MEIGVSLPSSGPNASPGNLSRVSQWAADLGYHSVWVSDHVVLPREVNSFYPYDPSDTWPFPAETKWLDPLVSLTWVATVAPMLKVGTSILILPLRNPILLAKQLSTLDYLIGGRLILGVGVGWMKEEFDLLDLPFKGRGAKAAEMVRLMRAFWEGGEVDFEGKIWKLTECVMRPEPFQGPMIPIVWGGHSDYALRRVARLGDGWHPTKITLSELREGINRLGVLCHKYDRDPETLTYVVRPHGAYPLDSSTREKHEELGIQHLVIDPPIGSQSLSDYREELERVAEVYDLVARG